MAASSAPPASLTLNIVKEYEQVPFKRALDSMYLTASIQAPAHESEERSSRVDLDVCCCVDKSGSMAGSKLEMVKETMKFMVQQLKPTDRLSIVSFDTNVTTDMSLVLMNDEGKKKADAIITALKAGSSTNLSGGLLTSLELLRSRPNPRDVCSLLLFTDGEANHGITDTAGIVAASTAVLSAAASPISVNTLGFGADHNSDMLRQIAERCGGMYYYLATKEEIAPAFGDVLGGLLSCVAQAIRLTLQSVHPVELTKVHSAYRMESADAGQKITITLPDIYSEEKKDILFTIKLPAIAAENMEFPVIKAELRYVNVARPGLGSFDLTAIVPRPGIDSNELPKINEEIEVQKGRIETAEALREANELGKRGDLEAARRVVSSQITRMKSSPAYSPAVRESEMAQGLMDDLEHSLSKMQSAEQYASEGAHTMAYLESSNMYQRGIEKSSSSRSRYGNAAQKSMRSAATLATTPVYKPSGASSSSASSSSVSVAPAVNSMGPQAAAPQQASSMGGIRSFVSGLFRRGSPSPPPPPPQVQQQQMPINPMQQQMLYQEPEPVAQVYQQQIRRASRSPIRNVQAAPPLPPRHQQRTPPRSPTLAPAAPQGLLAEIRAATQPIAPSDPPQVEQQMPLAPANPDAIWGDMIPSPHVSATAKEEEQQQQ